MAIGQMNGLHRFVSSVRQAAILRDPAALSDGRLLDAFLTCGDEAAFALLVKRHGPMVLGVCSRVLGNVHDAEDAFQAVFLVLARKAGSIVPRDLVGNWLHGVAYRTALQARGRLARHRARERQVNDMPHTAVAPDVDLDALHQALDSELDQLPEKYRVPVVLCDLEGRSRKEVAGHLKIPEGTLSSRLAKGRELLAKRLARHGIAMSAAALTAVLVPPASALEPNLVGAAVNAAMLAAAGQSAGAVSANVLALSEGVVKTMFLNKLKVISILAFGMLLGLGAGIFGMPAAFAPAVFADADQPAKRVADPEPLDGQLLLNERVQKELRLSKNQIGRIQAVSQAVDTKSEAKRKQVKELQEQIEQLRKRMDDLASNVNTINVQIEDERAKSLGTAAPDILSDKSVTRLRQIQRQQRGLNELLSDVKVQRMLKIDDEQVRKIETILKNNSVMRFARFRHEGGVRIWDTQGKQSTWKDEIDLSGAEQFYSESAIAYLALTAAGRYSWNVQALQKLLDVLTPVQQSTLTDWLDEPYEGTSWHALRTTAK